MFGWYAEENREIEEIFDRQLIQTEALNFIRGRSLEKNKPFLDERTNGLTYAAGKMKGSPLCYQLTMMADECERSPLALDAIQRL